jgi:site-specific DNA-methyltransferase (adenine-specific)
MLEVNKTYNMDCLDGLGEIEDNAIDLIIADPPYNIKKAGWDNLGGIDKAVEWQMKWIYKCCEKLKNQGVFYVFGGNINNFAALIEEIRNALPKLFLKSFIVWDKSDFYRRNVWKSENNNLRMYFNVCEYIIHFIKIENGSGKERVSAECVALFSGWYKKELQRLKLTAAEVKKTYSSATGKKPYMFSHYFTQTQFELPTLQVWEKVFYPLGFRYKRGASKEDFEAPRQNYEALRQDYEALRQDYEALRYYHNHQLNDASCNVFKDQNDANGKNAG